MQDEKDKEEALSSKLAVTFLKTCDFLYYLLKIDL